MILKSLLLQGFKSFPDKTEIRFSGGMTAIVGPNGSGKSNISDALRWVLGEQSSRMLRGAKMEDVIFGGTSKRAPLGFAEVSLILDNSTGIFQSEHTEIMVTRRYYRSGESEYYLNKKHCRLKDIHELFMDTGLGREGYSIIGQGRIDEILSLKSEDRREVFEEAAGITKFRYRKEEAQKKLAETEENLVRIRDIYSELEAQTKPLEKQAQKAKQYLALRDELRELEVTLWLLELEDIKKTQSDGTEKLEICQKQLDDTRKLVSDLYEQTETISSKIHKTDIDADEIRRLLREEEQKNAQRQSEIAVLKANIQNARQNIERTKQDEQKRIEQQKALKTQKSERHEHCNKLEQNQIKLEKDIALAEQTIQTQKQKKIEFISQRDKIQDNIAVLDAENFNVSMKLTAAKAALEGMSGRTDNIDKETQNIQNQLEREKQIQSAYESKYIDCQNRIYELEKLTHDKKEQVKSTNERFLQLQKQYNELSSKSTDCQNRLKMLSEMQKDYEGFSRAVKLIMKRSQNGEAKGIRGPVSSLIGTEPDYVVAIETALGAAASNIVVENSGHAKQAINFLKNNDGGRATFLPIDTIKPLSLKETGFENMNGCLGTADSLVQCAGEYRNIIKNLLARTVIVKDLDCAMQIAKAYQYRFRIVTLDGQMLQAGGAMTGGSVSKTTGTLARADTLRQLEQNSIDIKKQLDITKEKITQTETELKTVKAQLESYINEKQELREEQTRLDALKNQHKTMLERVNEQFNSLSLEQTDISKAKQGYENTILQYENVQKELLSKLDNFKKEYQNALNAIAECENIVTEQETKLITFRTNMAQNNAEITSEKRAISDLENLSSEMIEGLEQIKHAYLEFEKQINEYNNKISELIESENKNTEKELRNKIQDIAQIRLRLESEKTETEKRIQRTNEELLALERENARLTAQNMQVDEKKQQILDKMWEQYELTPTSAEKYKITVENVSSANRKMLDLRDKMRELGNVNLDAVEQYKTIMERFTFLGEQKQDLEHAQNELYSVIDELTNNMSKVFETEFEKLNTYFGETFKEIFGGGTAELKLQDKKDILNCGIDILVCPPGKAVKTITLLSGGEKAFVAISLYFAILKLRPTPFTVLDEIEAALDDVNVARFAEYVKRLSDKIQFIVITHRRGTMEKSDMLYGVTMQERGVSRLLMLNLAEAEKKFSGEIK